MKYALTSSLLLAIGASVFSASTSAADLSMRGTITPHSCNITLDGGGRVDFGRTIVGHLEGTQGIALGQRTIATSVTCSGPLRFAVKVAGLRPNGNASAVASVLGTQFTREVLGLGRDVNDKVIGGYTLRFADSATGGSAGNIGALNTVRIVDLDPAAGQWGANGRLFVASAGDRVSGTSIGWSDVAGTPPIALETLNVDLVLDAALNAPNQFDLSSAVTLDGAATLELIYL